MRTGVSETGNVEWFNFTISSDKKLHEYTIKELVNDHGCGGQECSWDYEIQDGIHSYKGHSKRYSD